MMGDKSREGEKGRGGEEEKGSLPRHSAAKPGGVEGERVYAITTIPPVVLERMWDGAAVLEPIPDHDWESSVVFNAAALLFEDPEEIERLASGIGLTPKQVADLQDAGGMSIMVYRAQGRLETMGGERPSSLGVAVFTPDLELVHRRDKPVLGYDAPHRNLGAEDPRCTRVGDSFVVYYTGYSVSQLDGVERRIVHVCVATTDDFVEWIDHGPIQGDINLVDNKNAVLLPIPVNGRWRLLHRPMEGPNAMTISLAVADMPTGPWYDSGVLMVSRKYAEFARSWIGAAGPPIYLDGWKFLMIFHLGHMTSRGSREYDLGAALLDFESSEPIRARMEPILRPFGAGEREGDAFLGVENVVFSCANYVWKNELIVPYAGADSRIFGAKVQLDRLVECLLGKPAI